jgi:hypothetical protein
MRKIIAIGVLALMLTFTTKSNAQDLDLSGSLGSALEQHGKTYLTGYMQPFVTAFGTGMGGAMYHRAYTKTFPRLDIGISAVYVTIPDDALTFRFGDSNVPTVFGSDKVTSDQLGGNAVPGLDIPALPLAQLQLNLGLFANLELTARGFSTNLDQVGEISLLGFGIKYGISDLIPLFPLDMAVQAAYSTFSVGEILNAGTFGMNLQASKGIPILPLDIYAGVGFETSSMTIKTDNLPGAGTDYTGIGDVTIDGENSFRMNVGASITLLLLNVHVDYNIGKFNSLGGGLMVVF